MLRGTLYGYLILCEDTNKIRKAVQNPRVSHAMHMIILESSFTPSVPSPPSPFLPPIYTQDLPNFVFPNSKVIINQQTPNHKKIKRETTPHTPHAPQTSNLKPSSPQKDHSKIP